MSTPPGSRALYAVIAALIGTILLVDLLVLPLGIPAWSLYLLPVVACLFAWRPDAPLVVAALAALLEAAGYFLKPAPLEPAVLLTAQVNRSFGFVTLLVIGATIREFVRAKVSAAEQNWVKSGVNQLVARLQGEQRLVDLGQGALAFLAEYVEALEGVAWVKAEDGELRRYARLPAQGEGAASEDPGPGRGLVVEAATDGKLRVLSKEPQGSRDSGGWRQDTLASTVVVVPTLADGVVYGALELSFRGAPPPVVRELLEEVATSVGAAVRSARYRERQGELLEQTQRQAEEVRAQQEALRVANDELTLANDELRAANDALDEQRQALARSAAESQRANRVKSEFLANMSHELRTPLNSLLILARLLADNAQGNLSAEQVKFAASIAASGNDLLTLINDLLDLAKIEAGRVELHVESFTLASLVDELKRRFAPLANDKKLTLTFVVEPSTPATVETDRKRLSQILTNLIANALKFTERGSIAVRVDAADDDRVRYSVTDTGIGIAAEHQRLVFEAFRQVDGTTHRRFGGTGLGLSIAQDLALLLGGDVHLRSELGVGSTFTVTLPRRTPRGAGTGAERTSTAAPSAPRPSAPRPSSMAAPTRDRSLGGKRVLLVEDDIRSVFAVTSMLEPEGVTVEVARTGAEALARLQREPAVDLVLMDVMMPEMDGLEATRRIRGGPHQTRVPIIVVTAKAMPEDRARCLEAGANDHLAKPIDGARLLALVRSWMPR